MGGPVAMPRRTVPTAHRECRIASLHIANGHRENPIAPLHAANRHRESRNDLLHGANGHREHLIASVQAATEHRESRGALAARISRTPEPPIAPLHGARGHLGIGNGVLGRFTGLGGGEWAFWEQMFGCRFGKLASCSRQTVVPDSFQRKPDAWWRVPNHGGVLFENVQGSFRQSPQLW